MAASSGHELGTDTPPPLVEAKLAVPSVGHRVVDRPRVRAALDAGRDASLTLVAAAAGYGKTTAVRGWCASLDAALAWVMLDAGDDDPVLLWRYVATAVDRVRPGLGRGALRRLGVAGSPVEAAVDELFERRRRARPGVASIVLDDLHAVTSRECLASIDYALAHLPPNAHVVARHARRSGAQARAAARRRRAGRGACRPISRSPAARRTSCSWLCGYLELGAEEIDGARRAHRGLARRARPGVVVAADRRRSGTGRAGVRRRPPLRGRLPEQRGSRRARRGCARVSARRRGPWRVHRGAVRRRARPHAIRRSVSRSSSARTSWSRGWSGEAGSASTRCSPNTRAPSSPRVEPGAPDADSSTSRRVVQVARAAGRGGRARGGGRRPRARRSSCWSSITCC